MRTLCDRLWNLQVKFTLREPHSWDPRQRTTWSRVVTSDFNSVLSSSSHNWVEKVCPSLQFIYRWVPGRRTWTHTSFCRELIILPGACVWSLDTYFIWSPIYHLFILFVEISHQTRLCLQITQHAIVFYNANGIFKLLGFCRSRPSAGNEQSVHFVSFPAGRMHSRPAGHTTTLFLDKTPHNPMFVCTILETCPYIQALIFWGYLFVVPCMKFGKMPTLLHLIPWVYF